MLNWFKRWRQNNREWNHGQNVVWPKFIVVGTNGLTQFQNETVQQLIASVGQVQLQQAGVKETYLTGKLPNTEAVIYIYSDCAEILNGNKTIFRAEREDQATPQALIQEFIAAARNSAQLQGKL